MSVAAAAASEKTDSVPQQCIKINKDLLDALVKNLLKSASPGTHAAHLTPLVEQRLAKILPSIKTPDHPPYALMIRQAITELDEEGGSNEEAISEFIKLKYKDLPWGHVNFLRHHLKKLKDDEEIYQVSGNRYKLLPNGDDSIGKVKKSKKRKRRSGKEECYSQCKVSKSGGSSKDKNYVDKEDQEKVTCGSRKESQLGLEVNEQVNQVHLDSEECERTKDASKEEALHHIKDADGLEQQKQEVTCPPRQETVLVVEVNEEVSQVPCVPSQLGSEIGEETDVIPQKECEGMEDVTPTEEASAHFIAAECQVLLQGQGKEFSKNQSNEVSCTARKQTALGFEVNGEANQLCEQKEERVQSRAIAEHELKSQQFAVIEDLQQKERIDEVIDTLIQVDDEPSKTEEENGLSIEREQIESIEEQKEANCKQDTTIEDLQNQVEMDPIQVEEDLDQMEEDNSLAIEGEKEETTQNNETEDQQDAPIEKQGAVGVSEEHFDGAIELQEQPMEMQGLSGVLEGQNVSKGAENLTEEQCDGSLQVAVIEKQVKAVGLQKQQQWEPEVNEQNLQLKEIGAEIAECIEKIITPQTPPKVVVGNKSCIREGEACGIAANLISFPALSSLRQEQCLELLSRTAKMQGIVVELLKSFGKAESSRRPSGDLAMLESNESEQLPNATAETAPPSCRDLVVVEPRENVEISCPTRLEDKEAEISCSASLEGKEAETELPLNLDLPVVEPPVQENVEEASMLDSQCQNKENHSTTSEAEQQEPVLNDSEEHQEVAVVVEPKEQVEHFCNSSTNTTTLQLEETMVENHQEKQPELHTVQPQVEPPQPEVDSTKTELILNLNSTLVVSGFLPEQEALNNKECSVESYVENYFQLKLPDLQLETISSIYLEGKEMPGHTVSADPTLLSLSLASQEQQQKATDFVDGNQQLYQQKEELPTPVLQQQNAEPSFEQQHVQYESQSVNLQKEELPTSVPQQNAEPSFWQQHVQSESQSVNLVNITVNNEMLQPNLFQGGRKAQPPFGRDANTGILGTPQKQQLYQQKEELPTPVLKQNAEPSFWQQHVQSESQSFTVNNEMLQPNLLQGGPKAPPSFGGDDFNTGIFGTPQKQQQKPMLLLHDQHKQMLSPQLPSSFDTGSLFGNSLFQQPLTISPIKPSSLSGGKLQPLKPIELKKLMKESVKPTPKPSPAKQMGTLQQVIDVDEIELREVASSSVGGFKRKLQFQASPVKSPSLMSSDKKVGEVVGEPEQVTPKKRRGRPPKQQTPGQTPSPQSRRPKIRQTVPKKKHSAAAADGASQSPSKPVIIPKNPF